MAEETTKVKKQSKIAKFFRDYKSEFKKIVWPARKDTLKMSVVVIVAIVVASIAIFLLDTGFSTAFSEIGKLVG
ncbi:MAG: preprotein translocase subunit SecE [Clostridiales bacterium]|nr:MAG: preprotein translocase subunit SecE [Clostridiales bacterium]